MGNKLIWPDYRNCIANLPNSILKKFGTETAGDTLPLADRYLEKDCRNIVTLILDGMGISILNKHLQQDGPFRSRLAGAYQSVFLSTTTAATTSALSGLQPCEHGWLGWDNYYPQIDRNVTVFLNTVQNTEIPAADYHVARRYTPYESVPDRIRKQGGTAYECMPFVPPYPKTFEEICALIKARCEEPGRKYIYAYWDQPDGLMHQYGTGAPAVHETLMKLETEASRLAEQLKDTLIFVTADHGHIDTEYAVLQDEPELCDCLVRMPSLEPRVLNFFIREGMRERFEYLFQERFGDRFILMPVEEALRRKLFGTAKPRDDLRSMLGDYLAIATGPFSIYFNDERWLSMHGSITEEEMMIPLIVFGS